MASERALAIVSESMANAVAVSGPTDTVRVYVTLHPGRLWMGVSDTAPEQDPAPKRAVSTLEEIDDADSETFGGWGLALVVAHADDVWTEPARDACSKWVCASINLRYRSA